MAALISPATPGTLAPDFSLPNLQEQVYHLRQFHGKIVLLNFWSAECSWTARTDAALQKEYVAWQPQVAWLSIAVNANEPAVLLAQTAQERRLPLVLVDAGQRVADLYGAQVTPHFFLLDTAGIVRYQGAFDDVTFRQRHPTKNYLVSAIHALQQGRLPDPAQTAAYGCTIVRHAG